MYYYGYNGYNNGMYNAYPTYYGNNTGYGPAFILVLFILLVIIFGTSFFNNNCSPCNNFNNCNNCNN